MSLSPVLPSPAPFRSLNQCKRPQVRTRPEKRERSRAGEGRRVPPYPPPVPSGLRARLGLPPSTQLPRPHP